MKRKRRGLFQRIVYYAVLLAIFYSGYKIYSFWYENYRLSNPQLIDALSTNYNEEQPLEGILLWDEQLIYAPQNGILTYPSPRPRMVSKGEIIAAVDGVAIRAPYPAYFFPGLDGQEGNWFYSKLWPDFAPFPEFDEAALIENGTHLMRGEPIGKLVPQPQILRCIAYLDSTPSLEKFLKSSQAVIKIRTEYEGKDRKAEVVAVKSSGYKLKVYLRLPFFPPNLLRSRAFSARVVTDIQKGVMIPDSAVITREGKNIVYVVEGNSPIPHEVEGFPADEENYFIEKGVVPGSKLILNADSVNLNDGNGRIW